MVHKYTSDFERINLMTSILGRFAEKRGVIRHQYTQDYTHLTNLIEGI